ncbi:thioesterase family protein [Oceanicoccus sp. KOV_DT_Chl]|uniref:acyl-CoA thioesterase n=1 Tax=Oceanicoccus sp. KOV_DT_Chl TaxID=1904639 RepID=UPI000C7A0E28|nr:thioesterase family protein [Oceanicoccus sp. KOV_DT_Chl]
MASKVSVTRSDYSIFYPVTTRWKDNDIYGHVNNVIYYSYFDTAANTFLIKHCGLDIHNGDIIGLVVSSGCEYLAPIAFPDGIEVGVRIDRLGNSSVQYGLAIFKDKEPQASAFGQFIHVFVDRVSHKPVTIPDSMRQRMQKITVVKAD